MQVVSKTVGVKGGVKSVRMGVETSDWGTEHKKADDSRFCIHTLCWDFAEKPSFYFIGIF